MLLMYGYTSLFFVLLGDGAVGGAAAAVDAGAIDEDLFEDEDLDELEEDMNDLEV